MTQPWQKFERVVAAIHVAEEKGATVTWNEDIEGRQFDVVIRFKFQFYEYLVLIECKDWTRPIKVEKVDAFVTKSKAAKANKAIMVSASGFQEGARKVARENGIELYKLSELREMPEDFLRITRYGVCHFSAENSFSASFNSSAIIGVSKPMFCS